MVFFQDKLFMAYVAPDTSGKLYVITTSDGITWSPESTSTNLYMTTATRVSPSLTVYNNRLYMAYVSNDGSNTLMVASSGDGATWVGGAVPYQHTKQTPALAVYYNKLYVAFTSNNEDGTLLIDIYDGVKWSGETVVSNPAATQYSNTGPSLAVFNYKLYIAFVAHNGSGDVLIASYDGTIWSSDSQVGQSTQEAVTLAVFNNELSLAFPDNGKNNHLLYVSSNDGTHWPASTWVPGQYTHMVPAMAAFNNQVYVAFFNDSKNYNTSLDDLFVIAGSIPNSSS
jgi:hypothetical protein